MAQEAACGLIEAPTNPTGTPTEGDRTMLHIRNHFRQIAEGSTWRDSDLVDELRADKSSMTAADVHRAKAAARTGSARARELHASGHHDEARRAADETAAEVAEILGEAVLPENYEQEREEKNLGPRELAAKVRRR
jgi:hypothetical protein